MYLSTPLGLTVAVARGFTHQRFQSDDGKMVDRKGVAPFAVSLPARLASERNMPAHGKWWSRRASHPWPAVCGTAALSGLSYDPKENGPRQRNRTAHDAGLQPAGFTSFLAGDVVEPEGFAPSPSGLKVRCAAVTPRLLEVVRPGRIALPIPAWRAGALLLRHERKDGGPCRCRPGFGALRARHPSW